MIQTSKMLTVALLCGSLACPALTQACQGGSRHREQERSIASASHCASGCGKARRSSTPEATSQESDQDEKCQGFWDKVNPVKWFGSDEEEGASEHHKRCNKARRRCHRDMKRCQGTRAATPTSTRYATRSGKKTTAVVENVLEADGQGEVVQPIGSDQAAKISTIMQAAEKHTQLKQQAQDAAEPQETASNTRSSVRRSTRSSAKKGKKDCHWECRCVC